jgi:nucleolar complex protein 3
LRFDEDLGKDETEEENEKPKKNKHWKNKDVSKQLPLSDKKKTRQDLISKAREEVTYDMT